jgi:hypothetical protein
MAHANVRGPCGAVADDLDRRLVDRVGGLGDNHEVAKVRLVGAAGGAAFSILVVAALAIAPGPSSASGVDVVEYYATHKHATLWQAALIGIAVVLFIWFVETFASRVSSGSVGLVGAAVTAALYLVAFGAWESLAETYGGTAMVDVPREGYGDAHVLYDVGVGATHFANFSAAAFVGASAVALFTTVPPRRRLAWIGVALTAVQLVNGPLQLLATSDWSDMVGVIVFLGFLAWVFALSAVLVLGMRGDTSSPSRASA